MQPAPSSSCGHLAGIVGPLCEGICPRVARGAAHGDSSAYRQMLTATLPGNVFAEPSRPYFVAHQSMEAIWDLYRRGGPYLGTLPTNSAYGRALRNSLAAAGLQPAQAHVLADMARSERLAVGLLDGAEVPRVPGKINSVRNGGVNDGQFLCIGGPSACDGEEAEELAVAAKTLILSLLL